ncbi:MAG: hypothetical protein J6T39_01565 [Clostridia bacterium]|nr:hypothetical protein [Clostridia bacterium]
MKYEKQIATLGGIKQKLNQVKNCSHAIILVSKDKELLEQFANLLIMQEVCQFSKKPCFACANCQKVMNGNAIDVEIFGQEKNILVADSAKVVADSEIVPFEFEKKYFVLKNFDRATEQAQNKLLKVIEEPRSFDKFIILTTNLDAILPTIKSRTEIFHLPLLTKEDLFEVLKKDYMSADKFKTATEVANGNLSRCIKILNDADFFEMQKLAEKLVMFMQSSSQMLEYSSEILKYKAKLVDFFQILMEIFVNLLETKHSIDFANDSTKQNQNKIVASKYSELAIIKIIDEINLASAKLKSNLSATEIVDNLLLKILEIKYLCK